MNTLFNVFKEIKLTNKIVYFIWILLPLTYIYEGTTSSILSAVCFLALIFVIIMQDMITVVKNRYIKLLESNYLELEDKIFEALKDD